MFLLFQLAGTKKPIEIDRAQSTIMYIVNIVIFRTLKMSIKFTYRLHASGPWWIMLAIKIICRLLSTQKKITNKQSGPATNLISYHFFTLHFDMVPVSKFDVMEKFLFFCPSLICRDCLFIAFDRTDFFQWIQTNWVSVVDGSANFRTVALTIHFIWPIYDLQDRKNIINCTSQIACPHLSVRVIYVMYHLRARAHKPLE